MKYQAAIKKTLPWMGFCVIVLIGAGLRLYRIEDEVPWFDELIAFNHETEEGLSAFLRGVIYRNPPVTPLYFILEYGWIKLFGVSVVALRSLSLVFSLGAAFFFFLFARRLIGPGGALLALACMAFSVEHIYYAQEIRMYALAVFLAALSSWAFVHHLERHGLGWLLLNVVANGLLVWSHSMGAILIMAQGITYLILHFKAIPQWITWGLAQLTPSVSLLIWVITRNPQGLEDGLKWIRPLNEASFLRHLTWYHSLLPLKWHLSPWGRYAFVPLVVGAAIALIVCCVRKERLKSALMPLAHIMPLLLCVPFVVWYANIFEMYIGIARYYLFASMAMYLLLAFCVVCIPFSWARYGMAVLLLVLLGYHTASFSRPLRLDWNEIVALQEDYGKPSDVYIMSSLSQVVEFEAYMEQPRKKAYFVPNRAYRHEHARYYLNRGFRVWLFQGRNRGHTQKEFSDYHFIIPTVRHVGFLDTEFSLMVRPDKMRKPTPSIRKVPANQNNSGAVTGTNPRQRGPRKYVPPE